jgi:hypothetical protein
MAAAPAIVTFVSGKPSDAINATMEMYEITVGEHKSFTIPSLDFRGTPTGIDLRKVVETGITPRINTGIAHKNAGVGQIGAGLVRPPLRSSKKRSSPLPRHMVSRASEADTLALVMTDEQLVSTLPG